MVLEPSQLQTLLRKSFGLGMDPDPRRPRALNRLEMATALVGVAEANATAAKAIASVALAITPPTKNSDNGADANDPEAELRVGSSSGVPERIWYREPAKADGARA